MKILVTGGITGKFSRLREYLGKEREITEGCVDILDTESGEITKVERVKVPDAFRDVKHGRDFRLTSSTLKGNRLYIGAPTQVYIYEWPEMRKITIIDSPYFNDVHHVAVIDDLLYVVSTGLDAVLVFSMDGEFQSAHSVFVRDIWSKFDKETDYRLIGSMKPHDSHPNFVFEHDGIIWCTRFKQRDIVNIHDHSVRIPLEVNAGMHDGILKGDQAYFTTVDGKVVILDMKQRKRVKIVDLNKIYGHGKPLGWCRGLMVNDTHFYVGFSVLRHTKVEENLSWMKDKLSGHTHNEKFPSRVVRINRENLEIEEEYIFKYPFTDMIFSLIQI